jgi:putative transposase
MTAFTFWDCVTLDPTLAAYVGEGVTLRYDPRDAAAIRVFHQQRFLCRA